MGTTVAKPKPESAASRATTQRKRQPAAGGKLSGAGVVNFCIHGSSAKSSPVRFTPAKLVEVLQTGLPFKELRELQSRLSVPAEKLAPMLGISKATLHRKKGDAGILSPAVSGRMVRYALLLGQATKVFDGLEAALQWLKAPQFGLGGAVPLEYAGTEIGAREVENLLGRIEYGVYS